MKNITHNLNIYYYLIINLILFIISIFGIILNKNNIINIMISIELMLLSINMNFIIFSDYFNEIKGQIFVLFILTVSAADVAIGLSILTILYKKYGYINIKKFNKLKN